MEEGRRQIDALMQPDNPPSVRLTSEGHSHGCRWRRLRPFCCGVRRQNGKVPGNGNRPSEQRTFEQKGYSHAQLIAIFVRHRAEIEHLALAKLQREGNSDRGVVVIASERYVHFLVDLDGRLPQRCRISFLALAFLEGSSPLDAHRDQSMRLFMKHRRVIEDIARRKTLLLKEPAQWVSVAAGDLPVLEQDDP